MRKCLKENSNDGWSDEIRDIVEEFGSEVEGVLYEVRNCVRGSYGGFGSTSADLAGYLRDIASHIENAADEIENLPEADLEESVLKESHVQGTCPICGEKIYSDEGCVKVNGVDGYVHTYHCTDDSLEAYYDFADKFWATHDSTGMNYYSNAKLFDAKAPKCKLRESKELKEDNSRFDRDFYNFLSETFDSYDGSYHSLVQDVRSIEKDWVEEEENEDPNYLADLKGTIRSTGETWLRQKGRELCSEELLSD